MPGVFRFLKRLACSLALLAAALALPAAIPCAPAQQAPAVQVQWADLSARDPEQAAAGRINPAIVGTRVRIGGFVVPIEHEAEGTLSDFLLVPYFGACIHVPPPPPNQIIEVRLKTPVRSIRSMDAVWVEGLLRADGSAELAGYAMRDAQVMPQNEERTGHWPLAAALTLLCGLSVGLGWSGLLAHCRISESGTAFGLSMAGGMLLVLGLSTLASAPGRMGLVLFACAAGLTAVLLAWLHRFERNGAGNSAVRVAFALGLHNFPECILVCLLTLADRTAGIALACAALSHNVPLALSLSLSPQGALEKRGASLCMLLSGVVPTGAALLLCWSIRSAASIADLHLMMTVAGGILVCLATMELLPEARRRAGWKAACSGLAAGAMILAALTLILRGLS